MRLLVLCLVLLGQGCGAKQDRIEAAAEPQEAAPEEETTPPTDEEQEARAMVQVEAFLDDVRDERYEQAYEASSFVLKEVYSFDQFLMLAGKLQMEEMPCITDGDIAAMERTTGNVGIGPKDVEVEGFLIRYGCTQEGEKDSRVLFIYLDWSGGWSEPGGVASVWWK